MVAVLEIVVREKKINEIRFTSCFAKIGQLFAEKLSESNRLHKIK